MAKYTVAVILMKETQLSTGEEDGFGCDEFLDDITMYQGEDEDHARKVFEDLKNG